MPEGNANPGPPPATLNDVIDVLREVLFAVQENTAELRRLPGDRPAERSGP